MNEKLTPVRRPRRVLPVAIAGLLALTGCGTAAQNDASYVAPPSQGGAQLPRPRTVLVYPFTIDPKTVQLDSGMKARLEALAQAPDPAAERRKLATEVQEAISETLVDAINRMGLHAVPAGTSAPAPGDVLIEGQILRVESGNATRRAVIGFGAGQSAVYGSAAVLQLGADGQVHPLQSYDADANSGRTPGLGLGAAGAAAGHVAMAVAGAAAGTVSRERTGLARDGETLAKKVATNIGTFFAAEGWIAAN
ncbi:MAG TPA: DUF4410 domain-containing protein [Acidisoma sp.]|jgi:hypothetical protein|uniref:DUF4410 domain-containing protein n=1 Tax=Acidisoma sp. TaxID=1872115 RepID=UPI002C50A199|nr:DUF4410 domain-containing protein [Acidisoma sp.]HTI00317.1 DUF4410 domain-containing protein [Acidisoma sp.]